MMNRPHILIIAGEVSGDMHAAHVVREIRKRVPNAVFYGIGGEAMRDAGVQTVYDVKDMAVMGVSEVLRRYGFFRRVFSRMRVLADELEPELVVLVDYPGFNLRFARIAHGLGRKVVYYICPQVWAWNRGRIPKMAAMLTRLITIFPFEAQHFEGTGLKVDFVGNPLVTEARRTRESPAVDVPWKGESRVALLPGSRPHEVRRILPVLWKAAACIEAARPESEFILAAPSGEIAALIEEQLRTLGKGPSRCVTVTGQTRQVLRQARGALVASGTATLEAALMRCPMVVTYKVSGLTYFLGKLLVKVDHIGMVNIVAGKRVCPEFIQGAARPQALADALLSVLAEGAARAEMLSAFENVEAALGEDGAEERAADLVVEELQISD